MRRRARPVGPAVRLRRLERENGFLVALDAPGEWYRYHHLFGELLQLELSTVEPTAFARLHAAASEWCREHGWLDDALEHAAAVGDPALVAEILGDEHRTFLRSGRLATLLRWSASLPEDLLVERPETPIAAVLAAGLLGSPAHIRRRFTAVAERARSERPDNWTAYHEAALGIGGLAWVEGDIGEAIERGRRAVVAMRDVAETAVPALASLGFLLFLEGDQAESQIRAQQALDRPEAADRPHGLVLALATLSLIESGSGRPAAAEETAREAVAAAKEAGIDQSASGGAARVALASALAGRGNLREARSTRRRRASGSGDVPIRRPLICTRSSSWRAFGRAVGSSSERLRISTGSGAGSRRSPTPARFPRSPTRSRRRSRRRERPQPWSWKSRRRPS